MTNNASNVSRRHFLKASGLTFSFTVAGQTMLLTPAQAYAKSANLTVLNKRQVNTLEALADAIVPGAKEAGIAHFIDSQLAAKADESLLMIKYLGVPHPHNGFYTASLDGIDTVVNTRHKKNLDQLDASVIDAFIDEMAQGKIDGWVGPPTDFFYFVLRSDAADVTYGTEQGFANLNIPYMAHIAPKQPW